MERRLLFTDSVTRPMYPSTQRMPAVMYFCCVFNVQTFLIRIASGNNLHYGDAQEAGVFEWVEVCPHMAISIFMSQYTKYDKEAEE